jgi:WD40 repeat protein
MGILGKAGGMPDDTVRAFDVETGRPVAELRGHRGKILALAFGPDGRSLVTASQDMSFRFWDVDSGKQTRQLAIKGHIPNGTRFRIASADFTRDLKWAVTSGSWDDRLIVWDLTAGKAQRIIEGEEDSGARLAIAPDGRWFGSIERGADSGNDRIRLWDMASGRELPSLATRGKSVTALVFAPYGTSLATGMADTTAIVWDLGRAVLQKPGAGKP